MAQLEVLDHAEIYRNPHPNLTSEYVAFPSIGAFSDGTLLCMCRHGTARESNDGTIRIHRSTDGGLTWNPTSPLPEPSGVGPGKRIPGGFGVAPNGELVATLSYPQKSDNQCGPWISRSADGGLSWSEPKSIDRGPFAGMGLMGNLVSTRDGVMVMAAEFSATEQVAKQPDWTSILTRSGDGGETWAPWERVHTSQATHYYLDPRITELADGRLLVAYWTHDLQIDQGLNVHTAWSSDEGKTWTEPQNASFWGQVTDVASLQSGRVIAVTNHRRRPQGIRALLSDDGGQSFDEPGHVELWGIEPAQVRSAPVLAKRRDQVENALDSYHFFTFGTPSVTQLPDGVIVVAFYVSEEQVTYVRCCRLRETSTSS